MMSNLDYAASVIAPKAIRLDVYLVGVLVKARPYVQKMIQDHGVRVNGHRINKVGFKLKQHDDIHLNWPIQLLVDEFDYSGVTFESNQIWVDGMKITILLDDEHVIVVNKPVGLMVHSAPTKQAPDLVGVLLHVGIQLNGGELNRRGVVHRLDQFTEGVMVLSKSQQAYDALVDQFKKRQVIKKYYALVRGQLKQGGLIDRPIGRDRWVRARQSCDHFIPGTEKEAKTQYEVVSNFTNVTLVDVTLLTGRTHQIRVHFAFIQHPVVGDILYGEKHQKKTGYLLQSYGLSFDHPISKEPQSFLIPVSDRLSPYMKGQ